MIYRTLFDRVLTRTDPEKAHHAAFRAIRAAGPVLSASRRQFPLRNGRVGASFPPPSAESA